MTAAVFRAEFRRALPLLPWLLACHAVTLGLRTRWSDDVTPQLAGIVEWATWSLALLVLIGSIWQDSPSRPERFLATRPLAPKPLFFAKLAALLLMVALPFIAVEFATLLWAEQSARILFLGTAQLALFAVVAVLAAFPLVGFWRNAPVAFSGLGVAFFGGALVLRMFGNHPLNAHGPRWVGLDYLLTPPVLLVSLAMAGSLSAISLRLLCRRPGSLLRIAVFTVGICLSLQGALVLRNQPQTSRSAGKAPLVSLKYTPLQFAEGWGTRLEITPPSEPTNSSIFQVRQFTRIGVDDRDALRWSGPWENQIGSSATSLQSHPVQHALRQHLGDSVTMPEASRPEDEPAVALIDDVYPPPHPIAIEAQIRETSYRWQVVADLPLNAGASAVHGGSRWTLKQSTTRPDGFGAPRIGVTLHERYPTIWLSEVFGERMEPTVADLFVLLDPSTSKLLHGSSFGQHNLPRLGSSSARRSLGERFISLNFSENTWWEGKTPALSSSGGQRLLILRAVVTHTSYYDWRSTGPVLYPAKWLRIPYIDSLKSVRSIDPPLVTPSDAAAVTRNGLGWLPGDLLFQDPQANVLTEEEWIAFFRLEPSAKHYRQIADTYVPRPVLEREVDGWLQSYEVRLPNPRIDTTLELALARGCAEAPVWLKESITRKREDEANYNAVWVFDPIHDSFVLPPGLETAPEVVDWFMAQDPAAFVFDPALGKFQLR